MIGQTIDGKYRLVRLLGEGGMGSVYEAEHTATQRRVAIKVMSRRLLLPGSEGELRLRREARAASAIDSEHIVQVLDAGTDEAAGTSYIAMERLHGRDLQQRIDAGGPLPPDVALRIGAQALAGLQKAHEARVVHRDIKPANLFLARRPDGALTVKILDFGIAKILADPLAARHTTGLTNTGSLLGSPLYMSPEQVLNGRDVDHRTDLWSLASALYCALAGHAPYQQVGTVGKLVYTICSTPPLPLHEVAPWVPVEVAAVIHGALALDPAARYPSAAAMLAAMRPLLTGSTELDPSIMDTALRAREPASSARSVELAVALARPHGEPIDSSVDAAAPISAGETTASLDMTSIAEVASVTQGGAMTTVAAPLPLTAAAVPMAEGREEPLDAESGAGAPAGRRRSPRRAPSSR
ncbi:serine/threonine-protein kinase [Sorangium sp. So ce1078]|uniref:serine/threonine-protein kinase n=1 Tax=Sorangium sp. So ce1078 TaxID=3133329 RepID=UPI003F61CB4D